MLQAACKRLLVMGTSLPLSKQSLCDCACADASVSSGELRAGTFQAEVREAVTTWPDDAVSQCMLPMVLLMSSADFDSALWPGASSPGAMQSSYAGFGGPPAQVMCCSNAREEGCSLCRALYLYVPAA